MYRPNVAAPFHGPPDEAPAASGARPRPEAHATAPIGLKRPGLGAKGTLDVRKLGGVATARSQQKGDDGAAKPDPGAVGGPAKKRGKATAVQTPPVRRHATPAASVSAGARVARRDPALTALHQTTWAPPGTRHPAGLAIDVGLLHRRDGRWLSVQHDFQGRIGAKTCGDGAPMPQNPDARELRALVCESSDLGLFTYVLTPDYNAAHADHFHMEIKPGVRWFLYH
jgi:hypothetical protein